MYRRLALAGGLAACDLQLADVQHAHRPAIDALVDRATRVADSAEDAPRLLEPRLDDLPPLRPESAHTPDDDLAILYLQDLQALPGRGDLRGFTRPTSRLSRCAALVRLDREPRDPTRGGAPETLCAARTPILLAACARLTHLAVVRIHEFVVPAIAACDPADADPPCPFHPGAIRGDVLIYRLADAALLGGFPVAAASSAALDPGTDPMADLSNNMNTALGAALTRHLPERP